MYISYYLSYLHIYKQHINMNIYILKAGPYFKIGKADDIYSRIQTLQTGCPYPIDCVASLEHETPLIIEKEIHRRYEAQRATGEWFALTEADFFSIITSYSFTVSTTLVKWDHTDETIAALVLKLEKRMQRLRKQHNIELLQVELKALLHGIWALHNPRIGPFLCDSPETYLRLKMKPVLEMLVEQGMPVRSVNREYEKSLEFTNQGLLKSKMAQKYLSWLKRKAERVTNS